MQTADYPEVPPDFGNWLAGFIDGEGCFSIHHHYRTRYLCRFGLVQRSDRRGTLELIRATTGMGLLRETIERRRLPGSEGRTYVRWELDKKAECLRLIELLDQFPLRSEKAHDYTTWREAIRLWAQVRRGQDSHGQNNARLWAEMAHLYQRLKDERAYVPPPPAPEFKRPPPLWED